MELVKQAIVLLENNLLQREYRLGTSKKMGLESWQVYLACQCGNEVSSALFGKQQISLQGLWLNI